MQNTSHKWCNIVLLNGSHVESESERKRVASGRGVGTTHRVESCGGRSCEDRERKEATEIGQGWTTVVRNKRKGLCTSTGRFVAKGVISPARRHPERHQKAPRQNCHSVGCGPQRRNYVYAMHLWHSEGMSTRSEELPATMWKPMIRARNSNNIGCDADMQLEVLSKNIWFEMRER